MGLKDIIREDINKIFLNNEEFSDLHMVDGKEIHVIVDEMELTEREKKSINRDMNYKAQKLIYVSAEEFGKLPKINRPFNLDGRTYLVRDASEEDGMYSITLEVNTGGK